MEKSTPNIIIKKLEDELTLLKSRTHDFVILIEQAMGLCDKAIIEMRDMVTRDGFCDQYDEIYFFKHIKPIVNSKFIFYTELFNIESHRPLVNRKIQIKYFENIIQKLQKYLDDNIEFYQYYKRKQTYSDHLYFVRGGVNCRIHTDNIFNHVDPEFTTGYDYTFAKIMAYESLMKYASNEIGKLIENPLAEFKGNSKKSFLSRAEWTGHNVEAIELIYALHSAKVLNYGNIEIKEIVKLFEKMFNIKLDNSYRTFKDIQGRKTIKTKFLDNLKQALLKRLEDLDR
jgi:hypothetical protein